MTDMDFKHRKHSEPRKCVPVHLAADLNMLEESFSATKTVSSKLIFDLFVSQSNVYYYALDLMYFSKDFSKGRMASLSHLIIESLMKWCKQNYVHHNQLSLEIKDLAISRIMEQPSGYFVELICDVFRVKDDYEYFKAIIKNALNELKFKEAFYLITALEAEKDFTLEEFVFPVFFLDKDSWVKCFLKRRPDLQLRFVQTLDSICLSGTDIQNFIRSLPYSNLNVRRHIYDTNRLQKLLVNYKDVFNFELKECKNVYRVRCGSALSYLVRKRYTEESIGYEAFEEMVKCIAKDNLELQRVLLMKLVCKNDTSTALKFVKDFNLHRDDWPEILINASIYNQASPVCFSPERSKVDYLQLRLDTSDIHFIDSSEKCLNAIDDISENYNVVGIDAEWRPNLGISKENLSIYQLAVWDSVYIFDILALKKSSDKIFWSHFVEKIFCNPNVLKLGYGCKTDVQMLLSLCQEKETSTQTLPNVLDLCDFFQKAKTIYPAVMKEMEASQKVDTYGFVPSKGLSHLCYTVLGKPLNKDEQFSDWEQRPLRESQLVYAALDAFCLLQMYEKLFHVLQDANLSMDEVIKVINSPKKENPKKEKKQSEKCKQTPPASKEVSQIKSDCDSASTPVSQFKVVVDNMIHGIGKFLRICGADVAFIGNLDDHMKTVEISQLENRIILTSGAPYLKIKGYVPENMIFCVPIEENARNQAAIILQHFNVQCTEADIFSRCSICSGNIYKQVSNKELFHLWSTMVDSYSGSREENRTMKYSIPPNSKLISESGVLESGATVQLSDLSAKVFDTVTQFFICTKCGKVYWEGSHFSRVKKHISRFIQMDCSFTGSVYHCSGPAAETASQILKDLCKEDSQHKSESSLKPESSNIHSQVSPASHRFMSFDFESDEDCYEDEDDI